MRCYRRHLNFVDVVIPLNGMLEPVLPVQSYLRHSVLVSDKESGITFNDYLRQICRSVFHQGLEHLIHFLRHRQLAGTGTRLGGADVVFAGSESLHLMIDIDYSVFQIYIL